MVLKILVLAAVLHPAIALAQNAPATPAQAPAPSTPSAKPTAAPSTPAPPPATAPAKAPAAATPPTTKTATTAPTATSPAAAPSAAPPPAPAPQAPAEVKHLHDLFGSGTWRCDGTTTPPGAASHAVKGAATVRTNQGNGWVVTSYRERKTKVNPAPYAVTEHFTYDPATKNFVRLAMDPMGGWSVMTSVTAEPNKLSFQGDTMVAGKRMPGKITYTKNDKQLKVELDLPGNDGQLARAVDLTCKR
jgi:hypothetical protein